MVVYSKGGYWLPTIPGQTCDECRATYTAHRRNSRFCSKSCASRARMKARPAVDYPNRICVGCGVVWRAPPSNQSDFCSGECRKQHFAKKRERTCLVCSTLFHAQSSDSMKKTCSRECLKLLLRGRKQSPETIEKRNLAIASFRAANPEREQQRKTNALKGRLEWLSVPENSAAVAKQASDRLKRLHADPVWQKIRDERSSRVLKDVWARHRDEFISGARIRYLASREAKTGINSPESEAKRNIAAKWIMTKAQEAMHTETEYDAVFKDLMTRFRQQIPFDATGSESDYNDYCRKIGYLVTTSPELRSISDAFLADAIPRFAKEYRAQIEVPARDNSTPTGRM